MSSRESPPRAALLEGDVRHAAASVTGVIRSGRDGRVGRHDTVCRPATRCPTWDLTIRHPRSGPRTPLLAHQTVLWSGRHRHRLDRRSEHRPVVCPPPGTRGCLSRDQRPRRGPGGGDRSRLPRRRTQRRRRPGSMDSEAAVGLLTDRAMEAFGRIDLLVSTVGGAPHPFSFDAISEEQLLETFRLNTWPTLALIRAALARGLGRQRGLRRHDLERFTAQDHLGHGLLRGGQGGAQRNDAHRRGRSGGTGCAAQRGQPRPGTHDGDTTHLEDATTVPRRDRRSRSAGSPKLRTLRRRCASSCPTTHGRSPASPSTSTAGTTSPADGRRSGSYEAAAAGDRSLLDQPRPPSTRAAQSARRTCSGAMPGSCTRRLSASAPTSTMAPTNRSASSPGSSDATV